MKSINGDQSKNNNCDDQFKNKSSDKTPLLRRASANKQADKIDFYRLSSKREKEAELIMIEKIRNLCENSNKLLDENEIVERVSSIASEYLLEVQLEEFIDEDHFGKDEIDFSNSQLQENESTVTFSGENYPHDTKETIDLAHYDFISDIFDDKLQSNENSIDTSMKMNNNLNLRHSSTIKENSYTKTRQTVIPTTINVGKIDSKTMSSFSCVYSYLKGFNINKVKRILDKSTVADSDAMSVLDNQVMNATELANEINKLPVIFKEMAIVENIHNIEFDELTNVCMDILLSITALKYIDEYITKEEIGAVVDFCFFYSKDAYQALATFDVIENTFTFKRTSEDRASKTDSDNVLFRSFYEFLDMPIEINKMLRNR